MLYLSLRISQRERDLIMRALGEYAGRRADNPAATHLVEEVRTLCTRLMLHLSLRISQRERDLIMRALVEYECPEQNPSEFKD